MSYRHQDIRSMTKEQSQINVQPPHTHTMERMNALLAQIVETVSGLIEILRQSAHQAHIRMDQELSYTAQLVQLANNAFHSKELDSVEVLNTL